MFGNSEKEWFDTYLCLSLLRYPGQLYPMKTRLWFLRVPFSYPTQAGVASLHLLLWISTALFCRYDSFNIIENIYKLSTNSHNQIVHLLKS